MSDSIASFIFNLIVWSPVIIGISLIASMEN